MNDMLKKIGSQFPTTINALRHSWPFENDLSDVREAYIEFEGVIGTDTEFGTDNNRGDSVGIYILLKEHNLFRLIYNFNKTILTIDSIKISQILSMRNQSQQHDCIHGFANEKLEIIMCSGKEYILNKPDINKGQYTSEFVCENTGRYDIVINSLMK
ncbi:hypothetical protein SAMN05660742_12268 [Propionispira arboris]|uniref:Uncharacterized protein n=1 Tax=Propionispira arboris TaxID=84035 RepID=A0A1H7CJ07_9FIRM|nr:hypothetical protein [Propionispira arboris]SEJ89783.1 hypothetical protein SAMN05660742_12268 [Propionispira arboris]